MACSATGPFARNRAMAISPLARSRATKTMRAPMPARASAATWPIPDVPPVITIVLPVIADSRDSLAGGGADLVAPQPRHDGHDDPNNNRACGAVVKELQGE